MTVKLCAARSIRDGRKMICRRASGHKGECHWQTAQSIRLKPPLELVAKISDLIQSLPEGDYTLMVKRVYINRKTIMIEFTARSYQELCDGREIGV